MSMETPLTGHWAFRAARDEDKEGHPQCLYCCLQFSEHPSLKTCDFPDGILGFLGTMWKEMGLAFGNLETYLCLQEHKLFWTLRSGFSPSALKPGWSVRQLTSSSFRVVSLGSSWHRPHHRLEPSADAQGPRLGCYPLAMESSGLQKLSLTFSVNTQWFFDLPTFQSNFKDGWILNSYIERVRYSKLNVSRLVWPNCDRWEVDVHWFINNYF